MNVLIIADPHIPVPPVGYGGAERIIAMLCEGLVQRGEIVDLLAGPNSRSYNGQLTIHHAPTKSKISRAYNKLLFMRLSLRASRRADVVVSNCRIDYLWAIARSSVPIVHVFHNPVVQSELDLLLRIRQEKIRFIGISKDQMASLRPRDLVDIVYNGTNTERMTFQPVAESPKYLAFLGRLTANKGVHLAIEAAHLAGIRLVIAGNISDSEPGGRLYFEREVEPHLGTLVEYIGPVDDAAKAKLLGGATALLFPIQWQEPFGLVMAEAMACGCPVIGWRNGSVPEIIQHGKTGFIVDSVDELVNSIKNINSIDRSSCRRDAETRFSSDVLVNGYYNVFHKLLKSEQSDGRHESSKSKVCK